MSPERLSQIRALYQAALDASASLRQALLDRECKGDDDLRHEVERLLYVREHAPEWPRGPVFGVANVAPLEDQSTITRSELASRVRFHPGSHLAQRYCIVHCLGRGGMGEVYRAEDLLLRQPVALKFLPSAAPANASMLTRFRNEVRTARQVSHPNVCRVYDIGEAEGLTYLSMEYVDGEDLASLLRRIGKLPQEKALEIAQQLCGGLAAAHAKGVIHRDLKPANIMLDSQGHVRITDFGIAGVAERIRDVRSGTPAYMAPEQIAGREVTARSDIYALGIVLHELLTGKRPPLPADDVPLDPAIERVIRRCLDPDPRMRPGTALSVAAALPGGDLLAAVLAKGEMPSPELVAEAGPIEGLRTPAAMVCLAVVIFGLALLCVLRQRQDLINQIPMENSSEVLAAKAREIAKSFGYTERPVDTLNAWSYDRDYLRYAARQKGPATRDPRLSAPYPPAVFFWYRQSPYYTTDFGNLYTTYLFNRNTLDPGMVAVVLDSEGRLLEFHARPPEQKLSNTRAPTLDWLRLFAAAGLDPSRFDSVQPEWAPNGPFDARAAWSGLSESNSHETVHVEAAAYQNRPVAFRILSPWSRINSAPPVFVGSLTLPMFIFFVLTIPAAAGLLAWKNARNGRGDRRGAFRLCFFGFVCALLQSLTALHQTPTLGEFILLFSAFQYAVTVGCIGWVIYMAFEPFVRKQAPVSLTSWNRLLDGRFRDPMSGGHLLVGVTLGVLTMCVTHAVTPLPFLAASAPKLPWSAASGFSLCIWNALTGVVGLSFALVLSLISRFIRRTWLALLLFVICMTLILAPGYGSLSFIAFARQALIMLAVAIALSRFGVLAAVAFAYALATIAEFPLTTNWSAWYAPFALFGMTTLVALALFGFITTTSGRRRWSTS
jgi:serine/threonine-protein kinase